MKLKGKTAIVTGGSQGIGAAIAKRYGQEGAHVAIVNHSHADRAKAVAESIRADGGTADAFAADMTKLDQIEAMVSAVTERWGSADILVNNAGLFLPTPLDDTDEATWDRMMDLNLKGPFFAAKAVAPGMRAKGRGKIINVSSIAGTGGFPNSTAYCVTKGGINMMTKALCLELAADGINVNALAPGNVATAMNESLRADDAYTESMRQRTPSGAAFLDTADMVGCAVFLASDDSNQVHGQIIGVDGGWTAW